MNPPRTRPLDRTRFRALLEAYGSRLASWPIAERAAAEALLAESSEAASWMAEHRQLDAWLDSSTVPEPSPALMRRIAEIPLRHPARAPWARLRPRNALAALAAAAVLGVVSGIVTPDRWLDDSDATVDEDYAMTWNGDDTDEGAP